MTNHRLCRTPEKPAGRLPVEAGESEGGTVPVTAGADSGASVGSLSRHHPRCDLPRRPLRVR